MDELIARVREWMLDAERDAWNFPDMAKLDQLLSEYE